MGVGGWGNHPGGEAFRVEEGPCGQEVGRRRAGEWGKTEEDRNPWALSFGLRVGLLYLIIVTYWES